MHRPALTLRTLLGDGAALSGLPPQRVGCAQSDRSTDIFLTHRHQRRETMRTRAMVLAIVVSVLVTASLAHAVPPSQQTSPYDPGVLGFMCRVQGGVFGPP